MRFFGGQGRSCRQPRHCWGVGGMYSTVCKALQRSCSGTIERQVTRSRLITRCVFNSSRKLYDAAVQPQNTIVCPVQVIHDQPSKPTVLCRGVTRNVSTPSSTLSTPSFWCHYRSGLLSVVEIASGKRPLGHSRPCRRQAAHSASCSARQHAARAWRPAAGSWRPCAGQIWPAPICRDGTRRR